MLSSVTPRHLWRFSRCGGGGVVGGVILFSWLYIIEMQMIFVLNFVLLYFQKMTWNSHYMPIALNGYSICKTEDREEQRQRKTSVSEDVNYWLTFLWTLLGMRIREMSNRCSRRAAWAISPALLTDDTTKGESELARGREGGEAPLWVYKFMLYPWPNTQTVSSMQLPIIIPIALSSRFFNSFSLCAQNPQWFIKWSTVLTAQPRAK